MKLEQDEMFILPGQHPILITMSHVTMLPNSILMDHAINTKQQVEVRLVPVCVQLA